MAQLRSPNGGDHTLPPATVVVPDVSLPETRGTHPGVDAALLRLSVGTTLMAALLGAW